MPMFDFICQDCREKFRDIFVKVNEDWPKCEKCGGDLNVLFDKMDYGIIKRGDGWTPGSASDRRKVD